MSASGFQAPGKFKRLVWGFTGRCAVCGKFRLTAPWKIDGPRCDRCDFAIERKEGHFIGAVGMNTIVTFAAALAAVVVTVGVAGPNFSVPKVFAINTFFILLVSAICFPLSKTLWSAIDLNMIALEPGEVDPRYDGLHDTDDPTQ